MPRTNGIRNYREGWIYEKACRRNDPFRYDAALCVLRGGKPAYSLRGHRRRRGRRQRGSALRLAGGSAARHPRPRKREEEIHVDRRRGRRRELSRKKPRLRRGGRRDEELPGRLPGEKPRQGGPQRRVRADRGRLFAGRRSGDPFTPGPEGGGEGRMPFAFRPRRNGGGLRQARRDRELPYRGALRRRLDPGSVLRTLLRRPPHDHGALARRGICEHHHGGERRIRPGKQKFQPRTARRLVRDPQSRKRRLQDQ